MADFFSWLNTGAGRIFLVATFLPLFGFVVLLIVALLRALTEPYRTKNPFARMLYQCIGGDKPIKTGALFSIIIMLLCFVLSSYGLKQVLTKSEIKTTDSTNKLVKSATNEKKSVRTYPYAEAIDWVRIGSNSTDDFSQRGLVISLGYQIDELNALLFTMVALIGSLIFIYSYGYMAEESQQIVHDHEVKALHPLSKHNLHNPDPHGPATSNGDDQKILNLSAQEKNSHDESEHHDGYPRKGRFGRFFLYLLLFCFSMFNLLIADSLLQIFISWELVGICSFFLIGFYYERKSATDAANKAFIVNRIGDAGFLIALGIIWSYFGTFSLTEIKTKLYCPAYDTHGQSPPGNRIGTILQGTPINESSKGSGKESNNEYQLTDPESKGKETILLVPHHWHQNDIRKKIVSADADLAGSSDEEFTPFPYWVFVLMGAGLFLGCIGKSAQFPLHIWLPDAMEGPTPVSALIHAATMVAAGVYLVARAFPLFAPEVLQGVAIIGTITLFLAATIAVAMNDLKRILAYSTVSQLGYMMLGLGVGSWSGGIFHLLTHAFFKALLFLGAGSVILACHHQQDIRFMGGLRKKMPITSFTMFIAILAITGTPFFSGWYSKELILGQTLGYALENPVFFPLYLIALLTAGLTAFYMFRLWFYVFAGESRAEKKAPPVHESPLVLTIPLMILAIGAFGIAWGFPLYDIEASALLAQIKKSEPSMVAQTFAGSNHRAEEYHLINGILALLVAAFGVVIAFLLYGKKSLPLEKKTNPISAFLENRWYLDWLYAKIVLAPALLICRVITVFDKRPLDPQTSKSLQGSADASQNVLSIHQLENTGQKWEFRSLDGWFCSIGEAIYGFGNELRRFQLGIIRNYIMLMIFTSSILILLICGLVLTF